MVLGRALVTACLLTAAIAASPQTTGKSGTSTAVSGRVLDANSGAPLPNVRVSPTIRAVGAQVVLSDSEGGFSLALPVGQRGVTAVKTGYARQEMTVATGVSVEFRLQRSAAVSGRVTNVAGEPVVGARVTVMRSSADQRRLANVAGVSTDDRGDYRIGGLGAEPVVLKVESMAPVTVTTSGAGRLSVQTSQMDVFFPGVSAADEAARLILLPGEERSNLDFLLAIPGLSDLVGVSQTQLAKTLDAMAIIVSPGATRAVAGSPSVPSAPLVEGTGAVRGRVVNAEGRPVARALVTVSVAVSDGAQPMGTTSTTDSEGRFELRRLPAGQLRIEASKIGYFVNERVGFSLASGESREGVEVRVKKWGAIEGRLVDERGDPLADAIVQLLRPRFERGRRSLAPTLAAVRTDDRGRYRLYGLPAGRYLLTANVGELSSTEIPGYARSFYPGSPDPATAQYIEIADGAEIFSVDFAFARTRTARVLGRQLDANGETRTGGSLLLVPGPGSIVGLSVGARIERDGSFEFVNVPPGQYVVQMSQGRVGASREGDFGAVAVTVGDTDVNGLVVQALQGSSISGIVTFNSVVPGTRPMGGAIDLKPVPVDPLMAPNDLASADINPDWTFTLDGITGARRLQLGRPLVGWALEAIRVNGLDVTDKPLQFGGAGRSLSDVEVVLTDRVSVLNGSVVDERSQPLTSATVVVFSTDSSQWYTLSRFVRRASAGIDGRFTVSGLPAGRYHAVALSSLPPEGPDAWQDPEYLASLSSRAATIEVGDGTPTTVRLEIRSR